MNDVWFKIAQFMGTLNGENINRESYVSTPEYVKALEEWKKTEQEWHAFPGRMQSPPCTPLFLLLFPAVLQIRFPEKPPIPALFSFRSSSA